MHAPHDAGFLGRAETRPRHHLHDRVLQRVLHDLEGLHFGQVAKNVDEGQPVHDGAVFSHDEVGAAALNVAQGGQAAAAGAGLGAHRGHVPRAVANEGEVAGGQVRDDDLASLPGRHRGALGVHDLDHHVFGREVHAPVRAFVGDEAGVTGTVAVGHRAAEGAVDVLPLFVVEAFTGDESHADAQVVHALTARLRVPGNMAERAGIAEQHLWAAGADGLQEAVQLGIAHLERGQQLRAHEAVTPGAHAVLAAQFDGRAPNHDFGVADVHAPPAGGAPLGGHVMADALFADEENQRLAAAAPGIEASQGARLRVLHGLRVGTDGGLVQQRQGLQVGHAPQLLRLKAALRKQVAPIGRLPNAFQHSLQPLKLQLLQPRGRPPLRLLHAAAHGHRGVALQPLLQRKDKLGDQAGVHRPEPRPRRFTEWEPREFSRQARGRHTRCP